MAPDPEAHTRGDVGADPDDVDGFDDVVGSAISNAVRRAIDGVGRNPLASLDAGGEAAKPTAPSPVAPEPDPEAEADPPPMPLPGAIDPYKLLGVNRRAPWPEITAAYKRRARAWHPDGADDAEHERREELIRDLNAAYTELRIRRGR